MLHLETKVIYRLAAISNTKVRIGRELTFMDCRDQGVNPWTKELSVFPSSPKDWLCILVSSNVGTYLRINLSVATGGRNYASAGLYLPHAVEPIDISNHKQRTEGR